MRTIRQGSLLLVAACLISGVYGALHNQISQQVSPDHFLAFKFEQFQMPVSQRDFIGAAIVGFLASCWMGLVVGAPILFAGRRLPNDFLMGTCLKAFGIAVLTALVVGLGALGYAFAAFDEGHFIPDYPYPLRVDKTAFARGATMHNFSYLGGLLGVVAGIIFVKSQARRI